MQIFDWIFKKYSPNALISVGPALRSTACAEAVNRYYYKAYRINKAVDMGFTRALCLFNIHSPIIAFAHSLLQSPTLSVSHSFRSPIF